METPTHPALRKIHRLGGSSSDYPRDLDEALHGLEYEQCVEGLGRNDQIWLIEFLDRALEDIDISHPASRKCLRELKTRCRTDMILPSSCEDLSQDLTIDPSPHFCGGFADVFEGSLRGSRVCVKRLRISKREQKDATKFSYGEAAIWKHLDHPNILPLLGITTMPLQFVSRWVAGGDLSEYLEGNPNADRLRLLGDVAKGLNYLHSRGVVHGDLKGPNILVDVIGDRSCACLADFDVTAVTKNLNSRRFPTKLVVWNALWSPPEVLKGEERASKEGDVYSFAMVMIEVFTAAPPFSGELTEYTAAAAVMEGKRPQRPTHLACTDVLWNLIQDCWKHEPCARLEISEALGVIASI